VNREHVVIVGAGLAGMQTAVQLRRQGWRRPIVLLGAEPHRPYDRPPLSKQLLLDPGGSGEPVLLETDLDADLDALGIELRTGVTATAVHPAEHRLDTDAGPLPYRRLVLATGAEPLTLPGTAGTPGVHLLRTLDDARALRPVLAAGGPVAVVGAGWIGAEFTTAARAAGCPVTVLEAAAGPLPGVLPAEVAEPMRHWYAAAGAELRTGTTVAAVRRGEVDLEVELADGSRLAADAVLVGVGSRPATGWLAGSPIALGADRGVLADAWLRTGTPDVYAVGDCASYPSARYGRRLLVQHWDNALQAPRTVAATLLADAAAEEDGPGGDAPGGDAPHADAPHSGDPEPYDPVPYFWSEQFGRMVQFAGLPGPGDTPLRRGGQDSPEGWTVCWFRAGEPAGVLSAVLTVDRPRDLAQGRRLIERATPLDPRRAADPAVPLKAAVR
jgi:NADPH-dependent 2,4-dienoyl-CoA reductase/sulfur reductase-like enzyme